MSAFGLTDHLSSDPGDPSGAGGFRPGGPQRFLHPQELPLLRPRMAKPGAACAGRRRVHGWTLIPLRRACDHEDRASGRSIVRSLAPLLLLAGWLVDRIGLIGCANTNIAPASKLISGKVTLSWNDVPGAGCVQRLFLQVARRDEIERV
ncbi:MAG: hypothetical protein MZV70_57790 [Desulfobacterales bacterium]|nr:hypothetical protein [Desulfobacterales bacterium]